MQQLIRIATRQSPLALWQANDVAAKLVASFPGVKVELVGVTTTGDRIQSRNLAEIGGKGLFIKELESTMMAGDADIAVHSMKDVPGDLPDGFVLAAICEREDPRDVVVSATGGTLSGLAEASRIGSSSLRRRYQVRARFPGLQYADIRGNVDTRIGKMRAGDFDAIILAAAAMKRLQMEDQVAEVLTTGLCLPAAGQGAVGIECREDAGEIRQMMGLLNHAASSECVAAERALARQLNAECNQPVAAFAEQVDGGLKLTGFLSDTNGERHLRFDARGATPAEVAASLAETFYAAGAADLLA